MKKILIYNGRDWGIAVGHKIALRLIEDHKFKIGCITSKISTNNFIKKKENFIYDYHLFLNDIIVNPEKFILENKNLIPKNKELNLDFICEELGIDTIWPYTQLLRDHVRSFSEKFYYSFRQSENDEQIILLIKALYLMCLKIYLEFKPDLMITPNYVATQHVMLDLYFKKKNIKTISISSLGLKKIGIFTNSYNDQNCNFNKELDKLNSQEKLLQNDLQAKELIVKTLNEIKINKIVLKKLNIKFFLKGLIYILRRIRRGNVIKKNIQTSDSATLITNTKNFFSECFYINKINKFEFDKLEDLNNFIYLPLQSQPEQTVDSYAPNFNNQIETARLIGMNLPKDYYLVVKDHPNMFGLRPPSYLDKIQRSPNVKLINYDISNYDILKKSKLMIGFSGSTFLEASLLNIPSILLGNIGTVERLPNVYKHNDISTITQKIIYILSVERDPKYNEKLLNYFKCALAHGMDVENYWNLWSWQDGNFNKFYEEIIKEINYVN